MGLIESLREECIQISIPESYPRDKTSVLRAITQLAKKSPILTNLSEDNIFNGLNEREKLMSTGFGKGIAMPHCAFKDITEFVIGILTIPEGVDFDSLDGKRTKLFVFMISPESKRNEHIRLLSGISRILDKPDFVDRLVSIKKPELVREVFLQHSDIELPIKPQEESYLFHVIIQDEEKFNDILTIFTELEGCSVSVVEINNASYYLRTLPLFASFWNETQKGFNRMIIAIVNKSFSNDVLRRINLIIDGLNNKKDVMVMVQKLFYFNGSLSL